jgi:hypothetical protein
LGCAGTEFDDADDDDDGQREQEDSQDRKQEPAKKQTAEQSEQRNPKPARTWACGILSRRVGPFDGRAWMGWKSMAWQVM